MDTQQITTLVNDLGFPIVASLGLIWFIWWIWNFVVGDIKPKLNDLKKTAALISYNQSVTEKNMIRLSEKLETVMELKEKENNNKENHD